MAATPVEQLSNPFIIHFVKWMARASTSSIIIVNIAVAAAANVLIEDSSSPAKTMQYMYLNHNTSSISFMCIIWNLVKLDIWCLSERDDQ